MSSYLRPVCRLYHPKPQQNSLAGSYMGLLWVSIYESCFPAFPGNLPPCTPTPGGPLFLFPGKLGCGEGLLGLVALNPCAGLWGWLAAASLASARGPGALTCSACCGPDANPPCAGERGAGTQTGVTTAPKAASLCSSRSREHFTSPPSSPPTPAASAAGAPHFRLVHKHGQPPVCALGHSAHLLVNQSSRSSPI